MNLKTVILPRGFKPVEPFFHGIDTRIFFPPKKKTILKMYYG